MATVIGSGRATNTFCSNEVKACLGKKKYLTKARAKLAIKRLRGAEMTRGKLKHKLMAYRCPHCHDFHIGHRP